MMQFSNGNITLTYTKSGLLISKNTEVDNGDTYRLHTESLQLDSQESIALIQMILMGQGAVQMGAHESIMHNPFNLGDET